MKGSMRKKLDCRLMPSESHCDLMMSGSEEHLLPAGVEHAVGKHGHKDTPELRAELRKMMKDE